MALTSDTQVCHTLPLLPLAFPLYFSLHVPDSELFSEERRRDQMFSILNILPHLHTSKSKGFYLDT